MDTPLPPAYPFLLRGVYDAGSVAGLKTRRVR